MNTAAVATEPASTQPIPGRSNGISVAPASPAIPAAGNTPGGQATRRHLGSSDTGGVGISDRDPGGTGRIGGIGASGGDGFNALGGALTDQADAATDGFGALGDQADAASHGFGALGDQADAASHGFGTLGDALTAEPDAAAVKSDVLEEAPTTFGEVPADALDDDSGVCGTTSGASDSFRATASAFASGVSDIRSVDDAADPSTDACVPGTESPSGSAEVRGSCPIGAAVDFEDGVLWSDRVDGSAPALRHRYRRVTRRGSPGSASLIDAVSVVAASAADFDGGAGSPASKCASATGLFGDT
ncbi:hypothetical protein ACQP0C_22290 [Nocardia sp. CA-129566]|uniref:hypothetical protein n=1 Tax=Nocardia sp. CA-129566 TaxID=3239976 RepID=UPI003D9959C1